jgi:hypothetical protein
VNFFTVRCTFLILQATTWRWDFEAFDQSVVVMRLRSIWSKVNASWFLWYVPIHHGYWGRWWWRALALSNYVSFKTLS